MWYIWLHPDSPLFGKDKMATFERYFLAEKETHVEKKNPYYKLLEKEEVVDRILDGVRTAERRNPYHQWPCAGETEKW